MQVHLKVFGRVQGVFFRSQAKATAESLGLVGWVRNSDDGSVETVAVGPKQKLDEFVKWCRRGPPNAYVAKVEIEWKKSTEEFGDFEIR